MSLRFLAAATLAAASLLPVPALAVVRVWVVPTSAWPEPSQAHQFESQVTGAVSTAVTWKVNGITGGNATVGTITGTGLYTAPATLPADAVEVSATSVEDPAKTAFSYVTVSAPRPRVAITPISAQVGPGAQQDFDAITSNLAQTGVTWRVNGMNGGNAIYGTISSSGIYTAPATPPSPAIVVISAVSVTSQAAVDHAHVWLGPAAADWYVSTLGSNSNNGSAGAPFRTIQKAASVALAGDVVEVAGGVYNETVTFPRNGTEAAGYIVFRSQAGQTAIIDGTGLPVTDGENGLMTLVNRAYLVIAGFELRNYRAASADVPIGIYVHGRGNHIQLLDNHVHHIITTGNGCNGNALGIAVYATDALKGVTTLTIAGNEVSHLTTGCSESLTIGGNAANWVVSDNVVHDNNNIGIDVVGGYGMSPNPANDFGRKGSITRNVVYNITSYRNPAYGPHFAAGGIYVDGGQDITVSRNSIDHADLGIELASENPGVDTTRVIASNNLVRDSQVTGITIGGYEEAVGGTSECKIVNNTLYNNDRLRTGSGEFQIQFNAFANLFQNNIVRANDQALFIHSIMPFSAPSTVNYNLYFAPGYDVEEGTWIWEDTELTGMQAFRGFSGQDFESLYGEPDFASATVPNLRVRAGSPAINAGSDPGRPVRGRYDIAGANRLQNQIDIGAYERP